MTDRPPRPDYGDSGVGLAFICSDWSTRRRTPDNDRAARAFRRLALPRIGRRLTGLGAGRTGRPTLRPYSGGPEPLALEPTLERLLPDRPVERRDIIVYAQPDDRLNLVVLMDTSLSMTGPHRISAAVAGAALVKQAPPGRLALIGFHEQAQSVVRLGQRIKPLEAAHRLLALDQGGVTDLAEALRYGRETTAGGMTGPRETILISDCERTAGADPCPEAARSGRLHVVLIGQRNRPLARRLADLGSGSLTGVDGLEELPSALSELLRRLYGRR